MGNWAIPGGLHREEARKPPSEGDVSSGRFLKKLPWHPLGLTAKANSATVPVADRMGTTVPAKSTSTRKPTRQSDDFHEILPFHKYLPILGHVLSFQGLIPALGELCI